EPQTLAVSRSIIHRLQDICLTLVSTHPGPPSQYAGPGSADPKWPRRPPCFLLYCCFLPGSLQQSPLPEPREGDQSTGVSG
ncbi:hypothetical protein G0U57_020114, partial [Chelydra serpentina]